MIVVVIHQCICAVNDLVSIQYLRDEHNLRHKRIQNCNERNKNKNEENNSYWEESTYKGDHLKGTCNHGGKTSTTYGQIANRDHIQFTILFNNISPE